MNIGIIIPGFSSDEHDPAIPVQLNLVRELAKNEDVRVLALRYPHRRRRYRVYDATVISLGYGAWTRGARRLALWADALRTLQQLHREKPFDVLHAMWADETGLIAAWAGRLLKIPVVVSVLGGEFARLEDYGLQHGVFSRWTVRQAVYGADAVIVACSHVCRLMKETGHHLPEMKIHEIVLGVDTDHFRKHETLPESPLATQWATAGSAAMLEKDLGEGIRHLIHAGSLIGVKDQATLLRALARLPSITLDIAGDGPERAHLEKLAVELGIEDRVNFLGSVAHANIPALFQRAALHVLPSLHEGLGMVTLEAAACGLPTVGTNVGLLPDYPALGVSVPVGDDAALAKAIADLLADEQRYNALRRSAHDLVTTHFTIQHTTNHLRHLYRGLL